MHAKVKIVSSREVAKFDEDGRAMTEIRTGWKFGERHGVFYDYAPKEGWSLAGLEERTRAHVNELAQLPE